MKLWELVDVVRDLVLITEVAQTKKEWKYITEWCAKYISIVQAQDRAILDYTLPKDFVIEILKRTKKFLYLSNDNVLRTRKQCLFDKKINLVEVYSKYGGSIISEVYEYGSSKVYTLPK